MLGESGGEPAGTRDVAGLWTDGVAAAEDHVLDGTGVDTGALDQTVESVCAEIGRVYVGQAATATAYRSTYCIDQICLCHDYLLLIATC